MAKKSLILLVFFMLFAIFLLAGIDSKAAQAEIVPGIPTNQLIIKYRADSHLSGAVQVQSEVQMQRLADTAGIELSYFRPMSGEAHVLRLPEFISTEQAEQIAARLSALPEVEYAGPDYVLTAIGETPIYPMLTPNDPMYSSQWHYFSPSAGNYGINAPSAWDITTGASNVYVAVLDTGILDHADLNGRWVGGYDMISNVFSANDADGRDSDPHDPGDWIGANECGYSHSARNSSWHGSHVAGTIAAATQNSQGVAGINWVSKVVPVRVLGRCGGTLSDIADGIRWAAGLSVTGAPANAYPAKVINMSLGGSGACDPIFQSAITDAYNAGSAVVVAAGNFNIDASGYQPASCNHTITVAATDKGGDKAYYSNDGTVVEISAPGGETNIIPSNGVLSTLNTGTTVPVADTYTYYQGTSMAAPHVAGIVSLMFSVNPFLTPAQVLSTLQSTVTAFPAGSGCNTSNCGSGIVDAGSALAAVPKLEYVYIPLVLTNYDPSASGWNNILTEDFEGAFPGN